VTIVSIKGTISICCTCCSANILAMTTRPLLVIAFTATITLLVAGGDLSPAGDRVVDPVFLRTVSVPARRRIWPFSRWSSSTSSRLSCARTLLAVD